MERRFTWDLKAMERELKRVNDFKRPAPQSINGMPPICLPAIFTSRPLRQLNES